MWIGPYGNPSEFKDPATGMSASRVGWGTSGTYITGGGWAVSSADQHLQYNLTWPFLRSLQVADLEDLVLNGELLTVLVATAYEVNAVPTGMTDLAKLNAGEHDLSIVPEGEHWQFSWEGEGELIIPDYGLVGPGMYSGVGTGGWFTISRPPLEEEEGGDEQTDAENYGGDMVLTFGDIVRHQHRKTRGRGNSGMRTMGTEPLQVTEYSAPSANNYHSATLSLIETGAWE